MHGILLAALERPAADGAEAARASLAELAHDDLPRASVDLAIDAIDRGTEPSLVRWQLSASQAQDTAAWLDWYAAVLMMAVRALIDVERARDEGIEAINVRKLLQMEAHLIRERSETNVPSPGLLRWWTDVAAAVARTRRQE